VPHPFAQFAKGWETTNHCIEIIRNSKEVLRTSR
jgi:hypothetical protein